MLRKHIVQFRATTAEFQLLTRDARQARETLSRRVRNAALLAATMRTLAPRSTAEQGASEGADR